MTKLRTPETWVPEIWRTLFFAANKKKREAHRSRMAIHERACHTWRKLLDLEVENAKLMAERDESEAKEIKVSIEAAELRAEIANMKATLQGYADHCRCKGEA